MKAASFLNESHNYDSVGGMRRDLSLKRKIDSLSAPPVPISNSSRIKRSLSVTETHDEQVSFSDSCISDKHDSGKW